MKKGKLSLAVCNVLMGLVIIGGQVSVEAALPLRVVVNDRQVNFPDGNAFLDANDRVLVPVRFVSEELGAHVLWNPPSQVVTITEGEKQISLKIGEKQIVVGETKKKLDTEPVLKKGRTYVPVRFVSEGLGAEVLWDNKINTVYINNNGKKIVKEDVVATVDNFSIVPEKNWSIRKADEAKGDWNFETDAKVQIDITDKEMLKEQGRPIFNCLLRTDDSFIGADYAKGCKQVEEILSQSVQEETVKKVSALLAKKTSKDTFFEDTTYTDGNYEIKIFGGEIGYVNVYVYKK